MTPYDNSPASRMRLLKPLTPVPRRHRGSCRFRGLAAFSTSLVLLTYALHHKPPTEHRPSAFSQRHIERISTTANLTTPQHSSSSSPVSSSSPSSTSGSSSSFHHNSPSSSLAELALAIFNARPSTPSHMVVAFSPFMANGFGAQMLRLIDAAAVAHLAQPNSDSLCVHEARYWNYGCAPFRGWSCYLRPRPCPPKLRRQCIELGTIRSVETFWQSRCLQVGNNKSAHFAEALRDVVARDALGPSITTSTLSSRNPDDHHPEQQQQYRQSAAFSRALLRPLWRLNERTLAHVRARGALLHLRRGGYVGVHVRRGDKARETAPVAVAAYASAVRLLARPREPVFLASDDGAVLRALRAELPDHAVLALPGLETRRGHVQARHNRVWMRRRYGGVADTLAELHTLAEARVFIATFSSNFARLVHVLRHASEQSSVSLDDAWEPGVAWHTFGKPYCKSEMASERFCRGWVSPY